ncbi:LamG domain-containing protein, partial [Micromonosporaceae bacterium Da 78-11]
MARGSVLALALGLGTVHIVLTPVPAAAAAAAVPACAAEAATDAGAEEMALRCARPVEVAAARSELTQTFVQPSGARQLVSAVTPQRVHRGDGTWTPVSTTLAKRADGRVAAQASTADIVFSGGGTTPLVTWKSGGSSFTLSWPTALPAPRLDGDSATYDEVLPGVALHVTATADGFRHALEVKSATAAANLARKAIKYDVGGTATRRTTATGAVEVVDAAGQVFATGGGASMWDSAKPPVNLAAARTASAEPAAGAAPDTEDLISTANRPGAAAVVHPAAVNLSATQLTVSPDLSMLSNPATVYPVYIDPPMNGLRERWAWANNDNFDTDVENRARVGRNPYDGALYRSFFNFNISGIHGTTILDAEIKMKLDHSYSCDNSWAWLYRTGAITVSSGGRMNWSTRPLPDHTISTWEGHANEAGGCGTIP